jgi:hypothetical protein
VANLPKNDLYFAHKKGVAVTPLNWPVFFFEYWPFFENTGLNEDFCRALAPFLMEISSSGMDYAPLRRRKQVTFS